MLKKFQTKLLLLLFVSALASCTAPGTVRIEDQRIPLNEILQVVQSNMPAGVKKFSRNGREYISNYFVKAKDGTFAKYDTGSVRYVALVTVLGDRRPYDIEIRVITERRARDGHFEQVGQDEGLARVISRRLEQALHKGREDRNVIDDFRPF